MRYRNCERQHLGFGYFGLGVRANCFDVNFNRPGG
jgi:hypothetical protein